MKKFSSLLSFPRSAKALLLGLLISSVSSGQQSYTFTTAGVTGSVGPSQTQINTAYLYTNLNGSVTVVNGVQNFTIPVTGAYHIEARGAQGFGPFGGRGATMAGDFTFTAGQVLKIVVGQTTFTVGSYTNQYGGGGGSFVVSSVGNIPLLVAGGGGGSHATSYQANSDGTVSASGNSGAAASNNGAGGTNGSGGFDASYADGGAGFYGDGACTSSLATTAKSFTNGATGGRLRGIGGFGGGGGTSSSNNMRGAGGGGYSGGGGSHGVTTPPQGGGGGSYNSGINQNNSSGSNYGDGKVIITKLCTISLQASGSFFGGATCAGSPVTLSTNAVSNYSWSTGAGGASISITPSVTTSYSLSAISSASCSAMAAITISVDQGIPVMSISNSASSLTGVCPSSSVVLNATGARAYSWSGGSSPVTNGMPFYPTISSSYIVTGTNACGTNTAASSVSVHPSPVIIPGASSASLCSGSSLTLTGTGNAAFYSWGCNGTTIVNGAGINPSASAVYTLTGISSMSCISTATLAVTVIATPTLSATAHPSLICMGNSSMLSASGAASYTWASATNAIPTFSVIETPSVAGVSIFTVTGANGPCVSVRQLSLVTNALPVIMAIVTPTIICAARPATLSAAGALTYTWLAPSGTGSLNHQTLPGIFPVVNPTQATTYTVAASDGTCTNTNTVNLVTRPNPIIHTSASPTLICRGNTVNISASGAVSYTWTANAINFYTSAFGDTPSQSTSYNVIGEDSLGCKSTASQLVFVNPTPTLQVSANRTLVCNGGSSTLSVSGANSFLWSTGSNTGTSSVQPSLISTGLVSYTVTGTYSATGCQSSKTVAVSVYVPTLSLSGSTITCPGGTVSVLADGANHYSYHWFTPMGVSSLSFAGITTSISAPSVFTVTALSTSFSVICPVSQTIALEVYPNPTITAVSHKTLICRRESVKLDASGGMSYVWSNGTAGNQATVSPQSNCHYTVTGTDTNGCVNTATVQVKVSSCTGIDEWNDPVNTLFVYPNPSSGDLTVRFHHALQLNLVNELGQIVKSIFLSESENYSIEITDLTKGVYFLTGEIDGKPSSRKILISN